jgi:pyridoxine 5-phosphate synthase
MISKIKLGVNIDHVATIRNARGGMHPDPVKAALIAQNTGADNITAHLREDRRHISDIDIKKLMQKLRIPLNLEMAPTKKMLNIALNLNLKRICLVPEKRKEITTEGGLDVKKNKKKLGIFLKKLFKKNIQVSLFINPNVNQISAAKDLKVSAIELNTGLFCEKNENRALEYEKLKSAALFAKNNNLECHAGHGITYKTVSLISKIHEISELNIGHFIIGESIFLGLKESIFRMRKLINNSRKKIILDKLA